MNINNLLRLRTPLLKFLDPPLVTRKQGRYHSFTEEEKARIAKRAAEFGVASTICQSPIERKHSDRVGCQIQERSCSKVQFRHAHGDQKTY